MSEAESSMPMPSGRNNTSNLMKQARMRRYPTTFRTKLSRKMDDYFEYYTMGEFKSAAWNFYAAIKYVKEDKLKRVFWRSASDKSVNEEKYSEFDKLYTTFRQVFGVDSDYNKDPNHTITFLELSPREYPRGIEDRVAINRDVNFAEVWGDHLPLYVYLKIGYYVEEVFTDPNGFPQTKKTMLIDPYDPNIDSYYTNVVPHSFWEAQHNATREELFDIITKLESYISPYLHREQGKDENAPDEAEEGSYFADDTIGANAPALEEGDDQENLEDLEAGGGA